MAGLIISKAHLWAAALSAIFISPSSQEGSNAGLQLQRTISVQAEGNTATGPLSSF